MDTLFEALGGLLKVVGWLMMVFIVACFAFAFLYVLAYSVFYKMAGC